MKVRSAIWIVAGTLAFVSTAVAAQQSLVDELAQRARSSHRIVVATASSVTPRWHRNAFGDELIVSDVVLDVEESFKGQPATNVLMEIEGGTIGGITLRVSGLPSLERGDRAVFFLDELANGSHRPHARGDGILRLDTTDRVAGSALRLADIKRVVQNVR